MCAKRDDEVLEKYEFSSTKLKNVRCTHCKHQFYLEAFIPIRGLIPLLMDCGHIVCDKCAKLAYCKPCPLCKVITQDKDGKKASMPIHIYTLGLIVSSHNRPLIGDDLVFAKPSCSGKQQCIQGLCQECGIQAAIKCPQCDALYCHSCYAKIHGRALSSHSKIVLCDNVSEEPCIVRYTCSEVCKGTLGYFCETCEVAVCSHCTLKLHRRHNYMSLSEKNQEFLDEFHMLFNRAAAKLERIRQAQKNLPLHQIAPPPLENTPVIEAMITQHFAQLHGILQNMERKMIDAMHDERAEWDENIVSTASQLLDYEKDLMSALVVTGAIDDNLHRIDVQSVNTELKKIIDIPSHLLAPVFPNEQIRFEVDQSIFETIQEHCSVYIPDVTGFSLQRTELLPADYKIEPLPECITIPVARKKTQTQSTSPGSLPERNNDNPIENRASQLVRVTHIIDPFCFYVQLRQNLNKIAEMHKELKALENAPLLLSTEVKINGLYAVESAKDQVWYRGRIVNKKMDRNEETYTVFFIDYGIQEENVPLMKIRNVGPTFATLPVMVFRCSLDDIVPYSGRWEPKAIEAFKRLVNSHDIVSMTVVRVVGDTFYVDIFAVSYNGNRMVSAKKSLTFMKYATFASTSKLLRMNPNSTTAYFKEELVIENYIQCEILFVESPSCIYVRKKNACRTQFGKLVREMMETYEQMAFGNYITAPYKDQPCAARDTGGNWQRGLILEVTENTVKVFFVDLGYSLILGYDSIRTLSKNFLSCRTQAIKLALRNVKPYNGTKDQWDQETIEFLKKHLGISRTVRVIAWHKFGDTYSVTIQTPDEEDLSQLLIKHKLALSTKMSRPNIKKTDKSPGKKWRKMVRPRSYVENPRRRNTLEVPEQRTEMSKSFGGQGTSRNSGSTPDKKEVEDPFKVHVMLHQVESPDCIYVSDATYDRGNVNTLIKQMQKFYKGYQCADRIVWKEGMVCAAYVSKDSMYYRAVIVEIRANDEVVVFLYDLGFKETVRLEDLHSLYPSFFKVPAYCFKIKLTGILPCGGSTKWPTLSCEVLRELTIVNYSCKFYTSKLEEDSVSYVKNLSIFK